MDQLRARAYLDIMLGRDSRPRRPDPARTGIPPAASVLPAGFAGKINLTVTLATLLDLAQWLGELPGLGPVDPDPRANTLNRYQAGA